MGPNVIETTFYGHPLVLVPGQVMTPRPATEALVDEALARIGDAPARVADVGTGSGAIAIALALRAPNAELWATEVSPDAALIAAGNVARHRLGERVHVLRADLLEATPAELDLVVANLPYLPARLRDELHYRRKYAGEPPAALFSPGDGLGLYRRLVDQARERLAPDGALLIQLHRRVIARERADLDELRAQLDDPLAVAA